MIIDSAKLPSELNWNHFINDFSNDEEIIIDYSEVDFQTLIEDSLFILKENNGFYLLETKGNILISTTKKKRITSANYFKNFTKMIFTEAKSI